MSSQLSPRMDHEGLDKNLNSDIPPADPTMFSDFGDNSRLGATNSACGTLEGNYIHALTYKNSY